MVITDRSLKTGTFWDETFDQVHKPRASVIDVVRELTREKIQVKHDHVVLILGNVHMPPMLHDPIRGMKNTIFLIKKQRPTAMVYISGILPRADDETSLTAPIMEINKSLASMCRSTRRFQKIDVKWIPLYNLFLERARYEEPFSEDSRFHTRIARPHSKYFMEDGKDLNGIARLKALKYILTVTGIKPGLSDWEGIPVVKETVQDKDVLLSIFQCRGKHEKEWEEEDDIEKFLRSQDVCVVDEVGPSTDDESDAEPRFGRDDCNLKVRVDCDDDDQELTEREEQDQPWMEMLVSNLGDNIPPPRKKRSSKWVSSGESSEGSPPAGVKLVSDSDNSQQSARASSKKRALETTAVVPESASDEFGEDTLVDVSLGE